jgi:hypothetical protein
MDWYFTADLYMKSSCLFSGTFVFSFIYMKILMKPDKIAVFEPIWMILNPRVSLNLNYCPEGYFKANILISLIN